MPGERGFILAAVAAVLVLLSALVGGAFFYALQEERLGRGEQAALRALAAAEAGAADAVAGWQPAREGALLPGDSLVVATRVPEGVGDASATIVAWGERLALARSRGVDPTGSASRTIALLIRLRLPRAAAAAPLVAVQGIQPGIDARVARDDFRDPAWRCQEPARDAPTAVLARWQEPWNDWDSLAVRAGAGFVLPDAAHPAVHAVGDITVIGGRGTGILLVDGDAVVAGGATLTGLLLVRGRLEFRGTGGQIIGAARAESVAAEATALGGPPLVKWSSCAVLRALRRVATPTLTRDWFWSDLSGGWQ